MSVCGFIDLSEPTAAELRRAVYLLAAGILLTEWSLSGCSSAQLASGRVEPLPGDREPGTWAITDAALLGVLVATVDAGARYVGWERACEVAAREVGAE